MEINLDRFRLNFDALAEIGRTPEGGVHRPAFSEAHFQARNWFREQALQAGLEFEIDPAGNHIARLDCGEAGAPTFLLGSHLDSVPAGGRFDGALGVVAALEVLQTVQDAGLNLPFDLEAIDFTDEEGTITGLLGSFALAGKLSPQMLANPRGGRERFLIGLARAGLTESGLLSAQRDPKTLAGYLELHIEQGSRLIDAGIDIGVVTGIVGIRSYRLTYLGRADHAGTAPMDARLDASRGASDFILALHALVRSHFANCTANVGQAELEPGAFNIVPAKAVLALEFRAPEDDLFDRLETAILDQARDSADKYGLGLDIEFLGTHAPAPMHPDHQAAISQAAESLGLSHLPLASGAGHDAQSLAEICPAGMIFVPSVGGFSHSPREFTAWDDCVNGANVLLRSVLTESVCQIFSALPHGDVYLAIWREFETGQSPEARFIRQIDKLELALQASVYEHQMLADLSEFYQSAEKEINMPALKSVLAELENMRLEHG